MTTIAAPRMTDRQWATVVSLLPPPRQKIKSGRPRMDDRRAMDAIRYVLSTGSRWKDLPPEMGAPSTVHDRFREWAMAGVFLAMYHAGLLTEAEMGALRSYGVLPPSRRAVR